VGRSLRGQERRRHCLPSRVMDDEAVVEIVRYSSIDQTRWRDGGSL
jgi:hypothetical protein